MYQIGNTVQLLTGGPKMTVCATLGNQVKVKWFDGSTLKEGTFDISELKASSVTEELLLG